MEVIYQGGLKQCRIAHAEALAVVRKSMFGRDAQKVRGSGVRVVPQSSVPKESLAAAARDFIIGPRDIPVVVRRNRSPEAVSDKIEQITLAKVIGLRKGVEVLQHDRVYPHRPGVPRRWIQIHGFHLLYLSRI